MIKAVIIDFDDTLCMNEKACFEFENEMLRLMGRKLQSRAIHKKTWGMPFFDAIKLRSPGINVGVFKQLVDENLPLWVEDHRMDHVPAERLEILDDLIQIHHKELYILTSRTHVEARHLLESDHDLATRIKSFYWREKTQYHKPDPRAFDLLLHEHRLKPEECVYVGDSPSDAAAAKQAGLHFIASLESGLRTKADFKDFPVDGYVAHLDELSGAITRLG